ncbi:MAG TPA: AMP-binding protein [Solirubrobacteraceae bacterium]|nr:AMP-binding protein [Solirubrobacteraceae bacterium]
MATVSQTPGWAAHLPNGLGPEGIDLCADGSLVGRWIRRWSEAPSRPQLQDVDGSWLTAHELETRTRASAERLRAAGLEPGDRFLLSGASSAEFVLAYVAALRAGLVVVPVNTTYTETEVARIVRAAAPAAAAVDDDRRAEWIRTAGGDSIAITSIDLRRLPQSRATPPIDLAMRGDAALLVYTSGTTGQPKGALLTHGNLLASATAVELAWRWSGDDRLLLTLPLFHLHGLGVGINGSLCAGASIVLRAKFDASDVAEHSKRGVTLFFGVPAMYERLAAAGAMRDLAGLRLLVSGSAPLPAALARVLAGGAGQMPLERYGMTETVMVTSNPYAGVRKPGTVGFPLPGVAIRLAGDGEVEVTGPNVIAGYYERPEANRESFTDDGWFRTGDLGEFDEDGYLRLVGRSKDLIITGGYNVHPREVEEAIGSHPDVLEVAVVGRPSPRWGEEVTAVVVAARAMAKDEVRSYAARQLAPYKVPKGVEFIDALPRNALGKVLRAEV